MAALIQTIAVLDKSGKAISTSRHLVNVFKEAKVAYRERKAEVAAGRHCEIEHRKACKSLQEAPLYDNRHAAGSRKHSQSHHGNRRPSAGHRRPKGPPRSETSTIYPSSHNRFSQELRSPHSSTLGVPRPPRLPPRSMTYPSPSLSDIDMDLAYGPIPPPLPPGTQVDDTEFKGLVNKVKGLLEEADCLHYSVSATITSLQKNPDAMAAVALTLAEISNVATKMAPGVLASVKGSAPAVFALLASPQFLIAGGVAVGVTIVALGGYKIIKNIRAKNAMDDPGMDEMLEIGGNISMIDDWRRGIAEVEEQSVGTSVDGEFITPEAFTLSKLNLSEEGSSGTRRKKAEGGSRHSNSVRGKSETSKMSSRGGSGESSKGNKEKRVKKPSPLLLLFK